MVQEQDRGFCVVTGAGGFIGSHLVERLLVAGYRVRALVHYNALGTIGHLEEVLSRGQAEHREWFTRNRLEIVPGDIQDARCVRKLAQEADIFFHLAALIAIPYSYQAPQSYLNVNVGGTLNVLEACHEAGVARLLITSTSETLGSAARTPQDETHPLQAQSPYAATKIAADKLAEAYHRSYELPVVVVRPFNVYGPRQSARAIVPTILSQALSDECAQIQLGALDPVRDLTYVEDTVRAFLLLGEAPAERVVGGLFHVGSGSGISIGELALRALRLTNSEKPVLTVAERLRPDASEVRALVCDSRRIAETVGWRAEIGLDEGLRRTAQWIREHPQAFRPTQYRQ